jgi:hypothetical protein
MNWMLLKTKVETFVLQHPALQDGFTLLKQTRLEPELILFPNKESLYRKEEKKRPVFYMGWQRVAVAAAFIGLAILLWTVVPRNKNTTGQNLAQKTPPIKSGNKIQQAQGPLVEQKKNNVENKAAENPGRDDVASTTNIKSPALINTKDQQIKNNAANNANPSDLIAAAQEKIMPPAVLLPDADPVTGRRNSTERGDNPTGALPVGMGLNPAPNPPLDPKEPVTASLVTPAVYKELDTDDEKKSLYLGSLEINKDKLRGFFRKAGSIFRSKAKQQEEERSETGPSNTRSLK